MTTRAAFRSQPRSSFARSWNRALAWLLAVASSPAGAHETLPAFPGAEGFGAVAIGGRGGDVYHVTSLGDDGSAGTLRHGIDSAQAPRTIVFQVGGIIELEEPLRIEANRLTLAGQTAPGGGITVARYPTSIAARNVIVRYMRFRCGDFHAQFPDRANNDNGTPGVGNGNGDLIGAAADALSVGPADRVIIDHVSASWSMDETLSVTVSKNVTVQHSIISESLLDSFHLVGLHGRGSLIRGDVSPQEHESGIGGYTLYGNIYAHHNRRSPGVADQQTLDETQAEADRRTLMLDCVNNVIYNWGQFPSHTLGGTTGHLRGRINYVGNYLRPGPSTPAETRETVFIAFSPEYFVYQEGNVLDTGVEPFVGAVVASEREFESTSFVTELFPFLSVGASSASDAYERALVQAGASLKRDVIDERIVSEVLNRTGGFIDSQTEVGGLLPIDNGPAPPDTDRDGMPDSFELDHALDPADPEDRNETTLSPAGYTNLEVYLHSLVEQQFSAVARARFTLQGESEPIYAGVVAIEVDAATSSIPEGVVVTYHWDFGDGHVADGITARHVYQRPGSYNVVLRLVEGEKLSALTTESVFVRLGGGDISPLTSLDIPEDKPFSGEARFGDGCLELFAGGGKLTSSDSFQFVHRAESGDVRVTARIAELFGTGEEIAEAGVMIRGSLESRAKHAALAVRRHGDETSLAFLSRRSTLTRVAELEGVDDSWVRLERIGEEMIGSHSADGLTWQEAGRARLTGLPLEVFAGAFATAVDAAEDTKRTFAAFCDLEIVRNEMAFVRGDCNSDTFVDVSDAVFDLEFLLRGGDEPRCFAACDTNADSRNNIADAIYLVTFLFRDGPGLAAPFPNCEEAPPTLALGCSESPCQ